ncbi:MAG: RNA-binding domain-containing protein [Rhodoferax sp.]|uniref:RNA-binding domain-containing protein n=1 Tax=Rhodoferax sp. TaxID=50421 RepID=UPI003266B3A5
MVEFKANFSEPDKIGCYLSGLANTAALQGRDRAWLVWGVEDGTHWVVGTAFDPFQQKIGNQSLHMWLQVMTQPRADFAFHELNFDGVRVVVLEIHPARSAPMAFQHVRYIRVDSHLVKLTDYPSQESRLWSALGMAEDWTGVVVPEASLDDLDPQAIDAARVRYAEYLVRGEPNSASHEAIRAEVASLEVATLLNKARVTKQGRVTRAALLILGRDESSHFLGPADAKMTWVLRDANNDTVTSQPFGIPFLLATEQLCARIRNVTLDHMPDGSLFPTPVPQYDNWVLREALHNCVAHQDYVMGGKVNVVEHPDRLVFSNLGQFIPESVEWMLLHQSPPEHYRNQWLIDAMIRLRMIEQAGSGIRRMFTTQRQRLFPLPDYEFAQTPQGFPRVELTLQGRMLDSKFARVLMARMDLDLRQVLLLDRVQKGQPLSTAEAKSLRDLGLIEGRAPRYFISAKMADALGQKAKYIHQRGLDDRYYQKLVLDYLQQYGQATRTDLDALLLRKLPDVLTDVQKANKVKNLMQSMKRVGLIQPHGARSAAVWRLR